jgi:hypothetical protein
VRALVVRAIDQDAANAGSAHFAEGDFLLTCRRGQFWHAPIEARAERAGNQSTRETPRSGSGDEAREVGGLYGLLAAAYRKLRLF